MTRPSGNYGLGHDGGNLLPQSGSRSTLLGRGPFDTAGSLVDPQPGEHYRVVLGSGFTGRRHNSRMDCYERLDWMRAVDTQHPSLAAKDPESRVIGIVRVIPRTDSLHERLVKRGLRE